MDHPSSLPKNCPLEFRLQTHQIFLMTPASQPKVKWIERKTPASFGSVAQASLAPLRMVICCGNFLAVAHSSSWPSLMRLSVRGSRSATDYNSWNRADGVPASSYLISFLFFFHSLSSHAFGFIYFLHLRIYFLPNGACLLLPFWSTAPCPLWFFFLLFKFGSTPGNKCICAN